MKILLIIAILMLLCTGCEGYDTDVTPEVIEFVDSTKELAMTSFKYGYVMGKSGRPYEESKEELIGILYKKKMGDWK